MDPLHHDEIQLLDDIPITPRFLIPKEEEEKNLMSSTVNPPITDASPTEPFSITKSWRKLTDSNRSTLLKCLVVSSLGSCVLGYDIGVFSGAKLYFQEQYNSTTHEVEVLVGSTHFVAAFGALVSGQIADGIGRKKAISTSAFVLLIGALIASLAFDFWSMLFSRVILGLGIGFALLNSPLYLGEVSPTELRGTLVTGLEISISIGLLLGYVSDFLFSILFPATISWRLMLGMGVLPPLVMIIMVCFVPESPSWLLARQEEEKSKEAMANLKLLLPSEEEIDTRVSEIAEVLKASEARCTDLCHPRTSASHHRQMLLVGFGISIFQQTSGIEAAVYYSPNIFSKAGITSTTANLGATIGIGAVKLLFIFVALYLMDKLGRRQLLFIGSGGLIFSLLLLSISFLSSSMPPWVAVVGQCCFIASFSIGFGPVMWVMTSEIYPLYWRGVGQSMGVALNRLVSGLVSMFFLSFSEAVTLSGAYLTFAILALGGLIFSYFFVPETKGKSLEAIEKYFIQRFAPHHVKLTSEEDQNFHKEDDLHKSSTTAATSSKNSSPRVDETRPVPVIELAPTEELSESQSVSE